MKFLCFLLQGCWGADDISFCVLRLDEIKSNSNFYSNCADSVSHLLHILLTFYETLTFVGSDKHQLQLRVRVDSKFCWQLLLQDWISHLFLVQSFTKLCYFTFCKTIYYYCKFRQALTPNLISNFAGYRFSSSLVLDFTSYFGAIFFKTLLYGFLQDNLLLITRCLDKPQLQI